MIDFQLLVSVCNNLSSNRKSVLMKASDLRAKTLNQVADAFSALTINIRIYLLTVAASTNTGAN